MTAKYLQEGLAETEWWYIVLLLQRLSLLTLTSLNIWVNLKHAVHTRQPKYLRS